MWLHVGRDEAGYVDQNGTKRNNGAMKALIVTDEAELVIQRTLTRTIDGVEVEVSGRLNGAINTRVTIYTYQYVDNHVEGDIPARRPSHKANLYDCFTGVVQVTATPQAFAFADTTVHQDRHVFNILPEPPVNYWSYAKVEGWLCKIITTRVCASWAAMASFIVSCSSPRHGLVAISSATKGTRKKSGQNSIALDAAKTYPGLVAKAWREKGIKIYVAISSLWVSVFQAMGAFTEEDESPAVNNDMVVCFISNNNNHSSRQEWNEGTKEAIPNNVFSYPGLIQYMHDVATARSVAMPHTILFSMNMASRGTPIKGLRHDCPLTDMYADLRKGGHDVARQQVLGRLCGIDGRTEGEGKIMWCSENERFKLVGGLYLLPFIVSKITKKITFPQLLREAAQDIMACNGEYTDVEEVLRFFLGKRCRTGIDKAVIKGVKRMKQVARNAGVSLVKPEDEFITPFYRPVVGLFGLTGTKGTTGLRTH